MITEIGGHDPENTGDPAAMREASCVSSRETMAQAVRMRSACASS